MNYKPSIEAGIYVGKKFKVDFGFSSGVFFTTAGVNQKFVQINRYSWFDGDGKLNTSDSSFRYDNSLSLTYIKVPLMLRWSYSFKGGIYPYMRKIGITDIDLMVGPYVSYLLSASKNLSTKVSVINTLDNVITSTEPEEGINDPYHNSFKIGGGTYIDRTDSNVLPGPAYLAQYVPSRPDVSDGLNKLDVGISISLGISFELTPNDKLMIGGNYSMGLLSIDKEYFADVTHTFSPGGSINIGTGTASLNSTYEKKDLKNDRLGFYLAVVKYLD
jgi:hypothetical protein